MKKLLAVLLVAVLAATPLSIAVSAADETTYTPYVINFDDGKTVDDYISIPSGNAKEALRKEKFSLISMVGQNGTESNALKIDGTVNQDTTTIIDYTYARTYPNSSNDKYFCGYKITKNSNYRFSAWFKMDENVTEKPSTANLTYSYKSMTVEGTVGTVTVPFADKLYDNPGKWIQVVTYFTTDYVDSVSTRPIGLSVDFGTTLKGTVYMDDMEIVQIPEIKQFGKAETVQTITFDDNRPYSFDRSAFSVANAAEVPNGTSNALKIAAGTYNKNAVININSTLNAQTDPAFAVPVISGNSYVLSAKVYVPSHENQFGYSAIMAGYGKGSAQSEAVDIGGVLNNTENYGKWITVSKTFKAQSNKVGVTVNFGKTVAADVYLDDITLTDVTQTVANAFTAPTTVQIRKEAGEVSQALRFKVTLNRKALEALPGYELVEYGCLTTLQRNVDAGTSVDYFPDGNKKPINGKNIYIGRAFVKSTGTDLVFDKNEDGSIVYTAALTNIGVKSNGQMNYNVWGAEYYVRPYIVLRNHTITSEVTYEYFYGDDVTREYNVAGSASVFGVMNKILNDETANPDDTAYVNAKLEVAEIKEAYDKCYPAQGQ